MLSLNRLTGQLVGALLVISVLGVSLTHSANAAVLQQTNAAVITSPTEGQLLQGNVTITGSASHHNFDRYELAYGPEPNPNDSWQGFGGNNQQVTDGQLGIWNTRVVADGTYTIRLRVIRKDSNYDEAFVRSVKISNQQPIGTPTFAVPPPTFGPEVTSAPVGTIMVEQPPTSMPTSSSNAANAPSVTGTPSEKSNASGNNSVTFTDLAGSACLGGLGWTFAVFVLLGVIVFSRSQLKHYRRRQRRKLSNADTQSTPPAAAH